MAMVARMSVRSLVVTMLTLLIWGVKDHALPSGNLTTGFDQYFTDLQFRLFTEEDHNVSQLKYREVIEEIREFMQGKEVPRIKAVNLPAHYGQNI